MMELHCIHRDLFGNCGCPDCDYAGRCDGIRHPAFDDEDALLHADDSEIGGGDDCIYFKSPCTYKGFAPSGIPSGDCHPPKGFAPSAPSDGKKEKKGKE